MFWIQAHLITSKWPQSIRKFWLPFADTNLSINQTLSNVCLFVFLFLANTLAAKLSTTIRTLNGSDSGCMRTIKCLVNILLQLILLTWVICTFYSHLCECLCDAYTCVLYGVYVFVALCNLKHILAALVVFWFTCIRVSYAYYVTRTHSLQLLVNAYIHVDRRTQSNTCSWTKTGVLTSSREFFILLYGRVFALLFHTRDWVVFLHFFFGFGLMCSCCLCFSVFLSHFEFFLCTLKKIPFSMTAKCDGRQKSNKMFS